MLLMVLNYTEYGTCILWFYDYDFRFFFTSMYPVVNGLTIIKSMMLYHKIIKVAQLKSIKA